jgi:hypothetical protein
MTLGVLSEGRLVSWGSLNLGIYLTSLVKNDRAEIHLISLHPLTPYPGAVRIGSPLFEKFKHGKVPETISYSLSKNGLLDKC